MFLIARQNRCLRRFEEADATSAETARTLDEIGVRDTRTFRALFRRGLFATAGADRYYALPGEVQRFLRRRRKSALIAWTVLGSAAIVGVIARAMFF